MTERPQTRICFLGLEPDKPVIPLAYALGAGTSHSYVHRTNAVRMLCQNATARWRSTALEEADIVVYPHRYDGSAAADRVSEIARERELPCLFFDHGDFERPCMPPHGVVYRTALHASRVRNRELAMSGLSDDMLDGAEPLVRPRSDRPSVGFCGNVASITGTLRAALRLRFNEIDGSRLRARAMRNLSRDSGVATDFVIRRSYWGGAVQARRGSVHLAEEAARTDLRRQFVRNIVETDYTLCVRGAGNYSIRFYEVLSAGRIPVFVDTDCVLPFEDRIRWSEHCVWVPARDLDRIGSIVREFHDRTSPERFAELQARNRRLWRDWLEATAFYERALQDAISGGARAATASHRSAVGAS